MPAITKNCMAPGCRSMVTSPHVVCVSHFKELPEDVRKGIQERTSGWGNVDAARAFLGQHYRTQAAKKEATA